MDTLTSETVLPRPVEPLPTPALLPATRKLAEKLTALFGMTEEAATALAVAVVDPTSARKVAENPERLPVPGGVVLGVRTEVWARCIIPDPRNPRIGPARRHPASNLVGRDESTRFAPLPEPQADGGRPQLVQSVQSQEHLAWAAQQARDYVLDHNDWRDSIRHQGVMTEVWITASTFRHADDTPDVTVPVTAEGSSRITAVHDILTIRSADVVYGRDPTKLRSHIRKLNEVITTAGESDLLDPREAMRIRSEKVPALLLVGFEPHGSTAVDFGVAVKSLVALRHVDYPKPWGEATENEALADAVVDELERRGLLTPAKAAWLRGGLTPEEAERAGFSRDSSIRAATITRLFTDKNRDVHEAVRVAITSQSTRKNITTKLLLDIATSLVLRSLPEEDSRKRERTRKYLKEAFSVDLARDWTATFRSAEDLAADALAEVANGNPGPSTRELAARSAYALVIDGGLTGDRGTVNSDQPDRRKPSEVLDRMRTMAHGVHQLHQALVDFSAGQRIRMVDEDGQVRTVDDGRDVVIRDADLRRIFYPVGDGPVPVSAPETPAEMLGNALSALGQAIRGVQEAVKVVESVESDDGQPAIDSLGADRGDCEAWRNALLDVLDKLPVWKQRSVERHGTAPEDLEADIDTDTDTDEEEYEEFYSQDG
ncbi:MAG: hypothetical protein M3394_00595 [Actinomycetota bacterium]|nr:hypothetical protein [Actinomycetota bacterium]